MTRAWMKGMVVLACAAAAGAATSAAAADGRPEALLGLRVDGERGQLVLEVSDSGCTTKQDFKIERAGDELTVVRLRRDACKMMPQRGTVTFTFEELGLKPHQSFTIRNPFTGEPFQPEVP